MNRIRWAKGIPEQFAASAKHTLPSWSGFPASTNVEFGESKFTERPAALPPQAHFLQGTREQGEKRGHGRVGRTGK